jgi:hypothetical protein
MRYRKLTETEKAIILIKEMDLTPLGLQNKFGGDAGEWGRILKGQHSPHGEHLSICKEINNHGYDASYTLQVARKGYGKKTRKDKIVPHSKAVFNALENFRMNQIIKSRLRNCYFGDDFESYEKEEYRIYEEVYSEGPHYYESHEDEENTRRDFLISLG